MTARPARSAGSMDRMDDDLPRPSRAQTRLTWGARAALVGVLLLAVVLTLTPSPLLTGLFDFHDGLARVVGRLTLGQTEVSLEEAEALANVLLFIPIGLLLRLALPRVLSSALLALATAGSLGIEVVQYLALPGRTPSLVDVLTNGGGAAIGLVLGVDAQRLVGRWTRRRARRARPRAEHVDASSRT